MRCVLYGQVHRRCDLIQALAFVLVLVLDGGDEDIVRIHPPNEAAAASDGDEGGAGGGVGIDIHCYLDAARPPLVDERQRLRGEAEVGAAAGLVVGDLDGHSGFLADANRFADGVQKLCPLVPDVADVEAAVLCDDARQLDQLFGLREGAGPVDQPGGEANRARLHRFTHVVFHRRELCVVGRPALQAHGGDADGAVGGEEGGVGGGSGGADGVVELLV